ncbi:unnamed protein product [Clavelina lepadiformis]|uniref:RecQ-mediated genome instability protein 1 n=1 Tax=Clavelina lepadiformis TaxID=159417 RepID=A0ABP0H0H0_CLALP
MTVLQSNAVYKWLDDQQIKVPRDWLDACIEWIKCENPVGSFSAPQLQKQVYQQWLMTDLNELSHSTLPRDIFNQKYTLTGMYCLQVNSVVDVSQPLYGQLQQMKSLDNSNSLVSAETQATQKPWETKASRMLMMQLTDGVVEVSGMEYTNITCINENMLPGCKIRVKGPIICKRGTLLLAASNIRFLGGDVENLSVTNSREAIVCRRLSMPPPSQTAVQANTSVPNPQQNAIDVDLPQDLINQLTDDDFGDSGYLTVGAANTSSSANRARSQNDVEPIEILDDDMVQEMERIESENAAVNYTGRNNSHHQTQEKRDSVKQNIDPWGDMHDDDILLQSTTLEAIEKTSGLSSTKPKKAASSSSARQVCIEDAFKQNFKPLPKHLQPFVSKTTSSGKTTAIKAETLDCNKFKTPNSIPWNPVASKTAKNTCSQSILSTLKPSPKIDNQNPMKAYEPLKKTESMSYSSNDVCPSLLTRLKKQPRSESSTSSSRNLPSFESVKSSALNVKSESRPSSTKPSSQVILYLCQAKVKMELQPPELIFNVKAFIVTLLSKLHANPDGGWTLQARICDGTGVLDVQFSDEVLTDLIGFSSKQADDVKRGFGGKLKLDELRDGMARCRDSIIAMCMLMKVKCSSMQPMPVVQELHDANVDYWTGLKQRHTGLV